MELNDGLIFGMDKRIHFWSFLVISLLLGIGVLLLSDRQYARGKLSYLWLSLVIFGTAEEYRQYGDPDRSAEFLDAMANMFGVSVGLALPLIFTYSIKFKKYQLVKSFKILMMVLIPMFLGLIYLNEVPFVTME
ncbi:VanZ family protein [Mesobacillus harenae]|uniref:VanZ family protein n=1 Tax=Mesobacillus harenae TaxID=2213203 RepID=UPI0015810B03|nr:VanZ family protein [Mesobacillus harenae]